MGLRFRKSVKIAPGVRMNIGKKGVSMSFGGKGFRVNTSSRGVSVSSSIPGTGISYQKQIYSTRKKRPQRTRYEQIKYQQQKEKAMEEARNKVEQYEAHIDMLLTVHEEANDKVYWKEIANSDPPFRIGEEDGPNVKELKKQIDEYKPTWRDRFFNRVEAKKRQMLSRMDQAIKEDEEIYEEWGKNKGIAQRVIANDLKAWCEVIDTAKPFEDIEEMGSRVRYQFDQSRRVIARLDINNREVVPQKVITLTKTGKVSEKNMAKGKYLQLYQDYVCSCTLRIAREFFNLLPVQEVIVNVYDESPAEEKYGCILSVVFLKEKMDVIDFTHIDCSDTIEQFEHNMKFLKTKGFKLVEEIR
ncbi:MULTISPECIES: DUF4236 domain-containing protein [Geobacillus]|uniref:DUF4236 domain-containing protein n=1 Tax=Geobacillus proteiniphilus TaxID=860353 RepID=A0A1Q5SVQ2_9BACL|nr:MULTISPECIES: DUF4236 domain-containing protein [Geobacillus]ODA15793.1 hypothetical protein A5N86_15440 [Geobacillus thermoleovorans]OKO92101.1 hypothetical protein BRO54_2507 [Geobacillus proteiniphilus]TWG24973.1 uncharacterized protein DUF4236 [Geobacillus sp. C56-T2]